MSDNPYAQPNNDNDNEPRSPYGPADGRDARPQGDGNQPPSPFGQPSSAQQPYGQQPFGEQPSAQQPYGQHPYGQAAPQSPYNQTPPQSPYGQAPQSPSGTHTDPGAQGAPSRPATSPFASPSYQTTPGGQAASGGRPRSLLSDGGAPNRLGTAAFFAGIAAIVVSAIFRLVQGTLVGSQSYPLLSVVSLADQVLSILLGLAAVILGFVALSRRDLAKVPAAIGLGIGATILASAVIDTVYSVIVNTFLY